MILVTGGTGLVGSHLLYFLVKDNKRVRALHRPSSDLQAVKTVFSYYNEAEAESLFNKIEWMVGDITQVPTLEKAFQEIEYVYHSAACVTFETNRYYELKKTNIEGTANIVNLCIANNIKKLCHVSSIATLGSTNDGSLISESTEWDPEANNNVYALTKYGAELEVWRGSQEGLDIVIVHPGVILGEGIWSSPSGGIVKTLVKGLRFYTSGGVGFVDVQDVARAMIGLLESSKRNQAYILVGKNSSYKESLQAFATALNARLPNKEIQKWKLDIARRLDGFSSRVFRTRRKLEKSTVESLYTTAFYDNSKLKNELDFTFTSMDITMKRIAKHYLSGSESSSD